MGVSKTDGFSLEQNELANFAKALGHPARIAIVQEILKQESCICNDLVEKLPLSQATISQHLKALKNSGLIKGNIESPRICYCINDEVWQRAKNVVCGLMNAFTGGCCK